MTDQELLVYAAKAVGIDHPKGDHCVNGPALWDCKLLRWWNPLTSDADAFRLMVDLRMSTTVFDDAVGIGIRGGFGYREYEITPDLYEATRRAIVRAAAEIGRNMTE